MIFCYKYTVSTKHSDIYNVINLIYIISVQHVTEFVGSLYCSLPNELQCQALNELLAPQKKVSSVEFMSVTTGPCGCVDTADAIHHWHTLLTENNINLSGCVWKRAHSHSMIIITINYYL